MSVIPVLRRADHRTTPFQSVAGGMIAIGIPSLNEAATVGGVVAAAIAGLDQLGLRDRSILMNCDNGSIDGTAAVFAAAAAEMRTVCLSQPRSGTGKGSNILAILHEAHNLGAERVVLLDADVRSVEPSWIKMLLDAVDDPYPTVATPVYRRNRYEGNTTNHLASPLMLAAFGAEVQQPVAGDFAFNRSFVDRALGWTRIPESAAFYGIDMWLTARAAAERLHIREVPLGRKLHNPGFPKILHGSQQMIDALFHAIARHGHLTPAVSPARRGATVDETVSRPDAELVARTVDKVVRYLTREADSLVSLFPAVAMAPDAPWGLRIDAALWAELLADALEVLAAGNLVAARDHLVGLYLCRVMTYWLEIDELSADGVDGLLDDQSAAVCATVRSRKIWFEPYLPDPRFDPGYWAVSGP